MLEVLLKNPIPFCGEKINKKDVLLDFNNLTLESETEVVLIDKKNNDEFFM